MPADPAMLPSRFDRLVSSEAGQMTVAMNVMKHLPALSAEDAEAIYRHVLTQRVLIGDEPGVGSDAPESAEEADGIRRDIELFTEGFLCGLRVAALVRDDGR